MSVVPGTIVPVVWVMAIWQGDTVGVAVGDGVAVDVGLGLAVGVGVGDGVGTPPGARTRTGMGPPVLKNPTVALVGFGG